MSETGSRDPRPARGKSHSRREENRPKVKFEIYGEEMLDKKVKSSGNSGRVYLPPEWVGKHIKVIRTD